MISILIFLNILKNIVILYKLKYIYNLSSFNIRKRSMTELPFSYIHLIRVNAIRLFAVLSICSCMRCCEGRFGNIALIQQWLERFSFPNFSSLSTDTYPG